MSEAILGKPPQPQLLESLIPALKLKPEGALGVYGNGYIARLTEALGETFESIWWTLGDEDFFRVCKDYIQSQESRSYNLADYGEGFPKYLSEISEGKQYPFLHDLAFFEWRFKDLFHQRPVNSIDPQKLSHLDQIADRAFVFGEAYFLFHSNYSIYDVWKHRKSVPDPDLRINWEQPQWFLTYKKETDVFVQTLTEPQFVLLKTLGSSLPVQVAISSTAQEFPALNETDVSTVFQLLVVSGILKEFK